MLKLEHHGEFASVGVAVEFGPLRVRAPGLSHGDHVPLLEGLPAQLPDEFMQPGAVVGDPKIRLFGDLVDHVQPEAAHAFVHPPQDHIVDLPADLLIFPVKVRLLHRELVEIVLPHLRHPLPGRAAEDGFHLVGQDSFLPVPPDIIVVIGVVFTFLRFLKPAVLVGGMVQHQVHDDPDVALLRLPDQLFHIFQGPEHRVNVLIIGDIVPVVVLGRPVDRGEPHGVDPQIRQVIQPPDDPRDVADPVPITVLETSGVDLIDHRILPPFSLCSCFIFHDKVLSFVTGCSFSLCIWLGRRQSHPYPACATPSWEILPCRGC